MLCSLDWTALIGPVIQVLGLLVTVLGWVIVYFLNVRSQERLLRNQVTDRARMEVAERIRQQEDRLIKGHAELLVQAGNLKPGAFIIGGHDERERQLIRSLLSDESHLWMTRLEEYEVLFPEASSARREIASAQAALGSALASLIPLSTMTVLGQGSPGDGERIAAKLDLAAGHVMSMLRVLEDLRIHLQNASLGPIVGRTIKTTSPPVAGLPHLIMTDGELHISPGSWAEQIKAIDPRV